MNDVFYGFISGFNIVVGVLMLAALLFGPFKDWTFFEKLGLLFMALGLLGQASYVLSGLTLSDPIWDQLWSFKDIGMWFFTIPLIGKWIDHTTRKH